MRLGEPPGAQAAPGVKPRPRSSRTAGASPPAQVRRCRAATAVRVCAGTAGPRGGGRGPLGVLRLAAGGPGPSRATRAGSRCARHTRAADAAGSAVKETGREERREAGRGGTPTRRETRGSSRIQVKKRKPFQSNFSGFRRSC